MKALLQTLALASAIITTQAQAAYTTDWRPVTGVPIETLYHIENGNWVGNTAQQAAELAADRCMPDVNRLQAQGYTVLSYRGSAIATASPYIFSGNCDAQVMHHLKIDATEKSE